MTALLQQWRSGDDQALGILVEQLYPELRRLARLHLRRERSGHTLEPTALVNEAYARLVGQRDVNWANRRHFLAVASRTMRRLLVEYARARGAGKRRAIRVSLVDGHGAAPAVDTDALSVVQALERFEEQGYAFEAEVVQLRFLAGLSIEETAAQLGVGHASVERAWSFARKWLQRELRGAER